MLDIKLIRERPDFVRERLKTRGAGDEEKVDMALDFDQRRRSKISEAESLKSQRNRVSKEIGSLMGQKKMEEAEAKKVETRELGERIAALDQQVKDFDAGLDEILIRLPNWCKAGNRFRRFSRHERNRSASDSRRVRRETWV